MSVGVGKERIIFFEFKFPARLRRAQNCWGYQRGEAMLSPVDDILLNNGKESKANR